MFAWQKLVLLVSVFLCGCASGFDRAELQERLNDGSIQISDAAIAEARTVKPQLRMPCRVAVYLKPGDREWSWTREDKAMLEQWAATLKHEGITAEVFPLPEMLVGKGEVKDLRLAAAKCGADVLLLLHGAAQTDCYKNPASVFNLTVIGGYIVPGSHCDALFMVEGCLLDVDNGYIYTAAQAEGEGRIIRPSFVIENTDAIARAKTQAIDAFGYEFLQRMRTLEGRTPPAGSIPTILPTPAGITDGRMPVQGQ